MRDYLFRGKRIYNGEWVYGNFVRGCVDDFAYIVEFGNKNLCRNFVDVIPETVGQYTGLTDKNGDKIFDSDVVDILTENEEVGVVTYDEGCFYVKADGFSVDFLNNINGEDLLVIGNIHDNPEILKWE